MVRFGEADERQRPQAHAHMPVGVTITIQREMHSHEGMRWVMQLSYAKFEVQVTTF